MSSQFQPKPMSPQNNDTLSNIDSGLIQCGTFSGVMKIICCVLFIIIFCGIGIYMFRLPDNNLETNATITDAKCAQEVVNSGKGTRVQTVCTLSVSYKVDEKDYTGIVTTNEVSHQKGELIKIKYDKSNPVSISYKQISNKTISYILIGVGCLFVIGLIIHIVLLNMSDWYKRLMCVEMVANTVSTAFSPLSSMNNYNY